MSSVNNFLGDSLWRVILKLLVASLLLGVVLATLGLSPRDIYQRAFDLMQSVWNMGFDAILRFGDYIMLGAAIVVPVFIVLRLIKMRG
ncbi:MAG: DUF6460 domain-containing protein [Notoacmeibacter sp.]